MRSRIRPATEADSPQLVTILADCATASPESLGFLSPASAQRRLNPAQEINAWQAEVDFFPTARILLVAEENNSPVGFAYLVQEPKRPIPQLPLSMRWKLHRLMVHPAHQGCGHGRRLVTACIAELAKRQAQGMFLMVYETQQRALSLYQKMGLQPVHTEEENKFLRLRYLATTF
jgi:ribosomal protein S18 acetylase RimI-like enzyme